MNKIMHRRLILDSILAAWGLVSPVKGGRRAQAEPKSGHHTAP
jgi:hypothetical protein